MQVKGEFNYLGIETFQGRKNPQESYSSLALLQGTSVTKIFLDNETLSIVANLGFKSMDKVACTLDISIGQKTYLKLVELKKVA